MKFTNIEIYDFVRQRFERSREDVPGFALFQFGRGFADFKEAVLWADEELQRIQKQQTGRTWGSQQS
jgi:hypothetical protein